MSDAKLELIESFYDEELGRLVDIYWNGKYGREGFCRGKVLTTGEWYDEVSER